MRQGPCILIFQQVEPLFHGFNLCFSGEQSVSIGLEVVFGFLKLVLQVQDIVFKIAVAYKHRLKKLKLVFSSLRFPLRQFCPSSRSLIIVTFMFPCRSVV